MFNYVPTIGNIWLFFFVVGGGLVDKNESQFKLFKPGRGKLPLVTLP